MLEHQRDISKLAHRLRFSAVGRLLRISLWRNGCLGQRPRGSRELGRCPSHASAIILFVFAVSAALCPTARAKNGGWDLDSYHIQINIALDAPGGLSEYLASELPRYLAE